MVDILPFKGLRYNPNINLKLEELIAPPYDVISPDMQDRYYRRNEFNVIRLILGRDEANDDEYNNKYTRAANYLNNWKRDGVLLEDGQKSIYIYQQIYEYPQGVSNKRMGIICLVKLEDFKTGGSIYAHENTFAAPKADRFKLIRTCKTNCCCVFSIYTDTKTKIKKIIDKYTSKKPVTQFTDENGIINKLWLINKKEDTDVIKEALKNKEIFIADGHHRYETALNYKNEIRESLKKKPTKPLPSDYVMMYLTNSESEGLSILPIHRILNDDFGTDHDEFLSDLEEAFETKKFKVSKNVEELRERFTTELGQYTGIQTAFGVVMKDGRNFLIKLRDDVDYDDIIEEKISDMKKSLDVTILQRYVIMQLWVGNPEIELDESEISFTNDMAEAIEKVLFGKSKITFLMNPTPLEKVKGIALANDRMPQKSTFFYPKLLSGIVLREIK